MNRKNEKASPTDVAKYFLARSLNDGELISNLKMQKLVYYAYAWTLTINKQRLFTESIEAWENGPVIPTLYQKLKKYGAAPIKENFLEAQSIESIKSKFSPQILKTLDKVYEQYMTLTAFELVVLTHSEKPWRESRKKHTDNQNEPISDFLIKETYIPS